MARVEVLFLSKEDIDTLDLTLDEIMDAIEVGLKAHGERKVIMPSKDHLPLAYPEKLFNILEGYVVPVNSCGVKLIGDFQKNYEHELPSEFTTLTLFRPETGAPYAIINATSTTWMRTGAVTAVGAKYLACEKPGVLGHIGARGTSWYNVAMLDRLFDFEEIRVTSKRPESRERFAADMSEKLGKKIEVKDNAADTVRDADIIIDASRLVEHEVLVPDKPVQSGFVNGLTEAMDALEMLSLVFGGEAAIRNSPVSHCSVNVNSPLVYDTPMVESLMAFAEFGQVNVISPFVMAGVSGPTTMAGALAQQNADMSGCSRCSSRY